MDSESEAITRKIESGEYFNEAMNWFHVKFTRPRTEFAYLTIICFIALAALTVAVITFVNIFPLAPGRNFVVGRHLVPNEHLLIKGIEKKGETADDAIIKFMISQYVKAREEYFEDRLDRDFRVVTTLSNDKVYNEYLEESSISNPQNPIVLYGKQASKEINIDDIRLVSSVGKPAHNNEIARAIVDYTTVLTFLDDNTQEITHHQADIPFQYRQIIVDQNTGKVSTAPKMVVTGYKTKLLETPPQQN
jgi:type IV secretory pathway component VirB8